MKIKFFLLITFCLIGLCVSEEINPEIPVEINENTEDGEEEEFKMPEKIFSSGFNVNMQTQEQVNLDGQKLVELFQREELNGGYCFLDVIEILQAEQEVYDSFQYELSCYKHLCQITSEIPSSEEWSNCRLKQCNYQYTGAFGYVNFLKRTITECLIDYEQEYTQNNNNSNNSNNNNTSQQNPYLKKDEIISFSSKNDSDNQSVVNVKNIGNDNKTFSCILSFLLIGFNIILF
ncbi:hypothetical protein TTHERM_000873623 (macronuclear) [Tetrahymena thermophila SB210]|uniref:Transmembrane protein n=1 Tax=Tetrahymena thermophila (strain SB210) TaxID=312017 RepID=W7XLQ9_TETTS|nr:hypothetical protein TTHERM_000873623 [Tetrahymena thermophila SB210]EWS76719.1 hypothetical protein TTHERM_000873623 [Tetrahymena thermophila SB210]|eukprot:XP_012650751.1 hypothetical protein TTHERM_000873623 [Tetrahymena thermophila SB210]